MCQSGHRRQSATQNARSAFVSLGRVVLRFRMASCCRKARFSSATSRCGFRLDRAVASRTYSKCSIGVGQLDPERGNVNDCAVDGVLRRDSAEEVTGTPVFSWVDDSGEERYHIEVFDTFGELIWSDPDIPKSTGSDPEVPYGGPSLESGMYYQFRVMSFDGNDRPLSRTEDLKGVFFLP